MSSSSGTPSLETKLEYTGHRQQKEERYTILPEMSNFGSIGDGLVIPNLALPNILQAASIARNIINAPFGSIYQNTTEETGRASLSGVLPTYPVVTGNSATASVTIDSETLATPIMFDSTGTPVVSGSPVPTVYGSLVVTLSLAAESPRDDDQIVTTGPTATADAPQPIVDSVPEKITIETIRSAIAEPTTAPDGRV